MGLLDIDTIVSQKIFNFKLFNYGVSYEQIECWWLERLMRGRYKKRYWIYRKGKYSVDGDKPADILFSYKSIDGLRLIFAQPDYASKQYHHKVMYWKNMQKPIDLIERVKARIDIDSLGDHSVFNTKDLGW